MCGALIDIKIHGKNELVVLSSKITIVSFLLRILSCKKNRKTRKSVHDNFGWVKGLNPLEFIFNRVRIH